MMQPNEGLMSPTSNAPVDNGMMQSASPQEEAQVGALMKPVIDMLHGKGAEATLQKIKAGREDLGGTIGVIAAGMIIQIEQSVGQQKGKVEDSVKFEVGQEIVVDLVEIAAAAGLIGDDDDSKGELFKAGMLSALAAYGDMAAKAGLNDREQAKQQLGGMVQGNENPVAKNIEAMLQKERGATP